MGFRVQIRSIRTPASNGGMECSGAFSEHEMCNTHLACGNVAISVISIIYILHIVDYNFFLTFVLLIYFVTLI